MECFLLKIFSHELTSPAPLIIKKMSNLKSTFLYFDTQFRDSVIGAKKMCY